jgi:hypothetical protein
LATYSKSLKKPSNAKKADVEEKRRHLQIQISKHEKKCMSLTLFSGEGIKLEEPKVQQMFGMTKTMQSIQRLCLYSCLPICLPRIDIDMVWRV